MSPSFCMLTAKYVCYFNHHHRVILNSMLNKASLLHLNSTLVKRQNDNPSPAYIHIRGSGWGDQLSVSKILAI